MRLHAPHLFSHIHEPMAMDFLVWLSIILGALLAMALGPHNLF